VKELRHANREAGLGVSGQKPVRVINVFYNHGWQDCQKKKRWGKSGN
jgi:hypothetical protein